MSTYETAENQFVTVGGVKYAYRLFGKQEGIPLFMHIHFRGNMDWWDPTLINPLAAQRPILLIDNAGVGLSGGEIGESFKVWAEVIVSVVRALKIPKIDAFGFSMGGFVAQMMALDAPDLVRKLIIAGAGPSAGEGLEGGDFNNTLEVANGVTEEEIRAALLHTLFPLNDKKQAAGAEWWTRMTTARKDRAPAVAGPGVQAQLAAAGRFLGGEYREEASYDRLHEIKAPTLIANGNNDVLVPTHNSYVMWQKLVNSDASLHLYPDSGHGFLDDYTEHFSVLINSFLNN
jgi:pimeloyl-ACP methyl ester carboxylesterase